MSNSVILWQMVSPEPEATGRFYQDLFGWRCHSNNALGYREVEAGGKGINGGIWPAPPDAKAFVQLIVEVADVDAAVSKAVSLGASVLVPRTALPDGDIIAVLRDPAEMTFVITTRRDSGGS